MRFSLSNRLIETFKIYIFSLSISSEDDWNKKKTNPFFKTTRDVEVVNDILSDSRSKFTLDCYTDESEHIHLIQKDFIEDTKNSKVVIEPEDVFLINISHLMESPGCLCPWLSPVISAAGDLTLCCNDSFFELKLGNLNDNEFPYLWFESEKIKKYRYSHIIGIYENMKTCQRCLNVKSIPLDLRLLSEYSQEKTQLYGINRLYDARINKKKIIRHLMLEVSSLCQNRCIYCNQKSDIIRTSRGKQNNFIDTDKLEGLFERLEENDYFFENIHLFWLGEPLLHPEIEKIFLILERQQGLFSRIELHTNAIALDEKKIEIMMDIDFPIKLHYSLDAISERTYRSLKGSDELLNAAGNVKNIILQTRENKLITHVVQFILHKENYHEADDFIDDWKGFFEDNELEYQITTFFDFNKKHIVYLRKWDDPDQDENILSDKIFYKKRREIDHIGNEGYADLEDLKNKKTLNSVCFSPFEYLVISSSGKATFCCHDTLLENTDIDLFEIEIKEFEKKINDFLKRHLHGEIDLCNSCPIRDSENSHNTVLEEALYFCRRFNVDTKDILNREFL